MADATTKGNDGFGVLGIGAAACVACCAPLIPALLGGLGLAASLWFGVVGVVVAVVAAVTFVVVRRRRRSIAEGATCAVDGSCGCG